MGRAKSSDKLLTTVELELMSAIWRLGTCTVRQVQEAIGAHRKMAYTSVATFMKILEQKKFLGIRKKDRVHEFFPKVSAEEYAAKTFRQVTQKVLHGDVSTGVMKLIDQANLTQQQLSELKQYLNEKL